MPDEWETHPLMKSRWVKNLFCLFFVCLFIAWPSAFKLLFFCQELRTLNGTALTNGEKSCCCRASFLFIIIMIIITIIMVIATCLLTWSSALKGSPSRGGDVVFFLAKDIKPNELAHSFLFCSWVYIAVFMTLSAVFHSINPPVNSPLSHSALPVLILPYWSFHLCISLWKSSSAPM